MFYPHSKTIHLPLHMIKSLTLISDFSSVLYLTRWLVIYWWVKIITFYTLFSQQSPPLQLRNLNFSLPLVRSVHVIAKGQTTFHASTFTTHKSNYIVPTITFSINIILIVLYNLFGSTFSIVLVETSTICLVTSLSFIAFDLGTGD